jgi:Ricin-type beta-trefoil lectin domain
LSSMERPGLLVRRVAPALALAASVAVIAQAAPASAAPAAPAVRHSAAPVHARTGIALYGYTFQNAATATCLDANPTQWNNDPGWPYLWTCNGTPQQHWYAPGWDAGSDQSELRVIGPPYGPANKCLNAWPEANYPNEMRVTTWTCNGGNQQEWDRVWDGSGYEFQNVLWGVCLYTTGPQLYNGAYIGGEPCNSGWYETWYTD